MTLLWLVATLSFQVATSLAHPTQPHSTPAEPDPAFAVEVELGGKTYVNKVCLF